MLKYTLVIVLSIITSFALKGQRKNEVSWDSTSVASQRKVEWDMSLAFKTKNVFRGVLPSAAPVFSAQAGMFYKNWVLGVYGGGGLDGYYQETDFILAYRQARFNVRIEYYYNYTNGITDIPEPSGIFDFNKQTTRGLLDFIVDVKLDAAGKWNFTSATILFGRDTDVETIGDGDDSYTQRTNQRYSQYLELQRTWAWDNNKLQAFVGGTFSWSNPLGAVLYGHKAGFNNVGFSYGKKVKINDHITLPVKVTSHINTITEAAYVVFSVNLLQLSK